MKVASHQILRNILGFNVMIFILPILLGAAALITGSMGIAAGAEGISNLQEAQKIAEDAKKRYEARRTLVEKASRLTEEKAEKYGQLQIQIKLKTIGRFVGFLEKIGQQVSQQELKLLEGLEGASPQQIHEYKAAEIEAKSLLSGGLQALGAAYAAGQGTLALVTLFGTASTGAAISGLSGAAAWNATLAALGGGSLAAGGGGMALGAAVLGGITVGPALMIGGFVLGSQGEKALTEAHRYQEQVDVEMANLKSFEDSLEKVQQRIAELTDILNYLNSKALASLSELESMPFNFTRDVEKFQRAALLIKAMAEIVKIPILDSQGNLNQETTNLKAKYRTL